eukprot:TRINITY_DN1176_c0_g2_i1.p1 TRINITY_DN1176_c0_g2~~TRINITY_DN1176_c0_g2_i1.p1  ORF type:complete len:189 (+),score=7.46 TRINITY_DN1176_c0_g2_i1:76-642(+)
MPTRACSVEPTETELLKLASTDAFKDWRRAATREEYRKNKSKLANDSRRSVQAAWCCQILCVAGLFLTWGDQSGLEILGEINTRSLILLSHIASYTPLLFGRKDTAALLICVSYLALMFTTSNASPSVGTAPPVYAAISCIELWITFTSTDSRAARLNYDPLLGKPLSPNNGQASQVGKHLNSSRKDD